MPPHQLPAIALQYDCVPVEEIFNENTIGAGFGVEKDDTKLYEATNCNTQIYALIKKVCSNDDKNGLEQQHNLVWKLAIPPRRQ